MRSLSLWRTRLILTVLALGFQPQKVVAEETESSDYLEEIQDLLNRTRVIPFYTEDEEGNQIPVTTIAVTGIQVPGVSDQMSQPIIVGTFAENVLVMQELYVCDENATDFEASCVLIPESYHQVVGGTLVNLFDLLSAAVWEEFLRTNPGNIPELDSLLGITNTT